MKNGLGDRIVAILKNGTCGGGDIIALLNEYPPVRLLYTRSLGGRDQLSLMQHTTNVMRNFEDVFEKRTSLLFSPAYFKLLIAVHDLGKPQAMDDHRNDIQHDYTVAILEDSLRDLSLPAELFVPMMTILHSDPIGKHLNKKHAIPLDEALEEIREMACAMSVSVSDLWKTLLVYFQCDAAGYPSLCKKVFITDTDSTPTYFENLGRFEFADREERAKFHTLEIRVLENA